MLLAMIETTTARSTQCIQYICFVPLVNENIVATLRGRRDLILGHFEHESDAWGYGQILVSMGSKPIDLLKRTMAYQQSRFAAPSKPFPNLGPDNSHELYAGKLTYCTWNSLQPPTPTTATSVIRALESFPLMPNNLLIDDGWQTTSDRKMSDWGANESWLDGYKNLGEVISHVKSIGVEKVGVWHTVLGYWNGVSKNSDAFNHVPFLTLCKDWGGRYDIIHPMKVDEFFDKWYSMLAECGVDFVKCDDMAEIEDMDSCVDEKGNWFPLNVVRTAYVQSIQKHVQKYFSGRIIWYRSNKGPSDIYRCMAHSPRHLLGPHALSKSTNIKPLRSSNDYFPDIPNSHAYHVYTNLLTSQFLSSFTIPDFDMFQTHPSLTSDAAEKQGAFHGSLRALGNGPVTVTDVPERCVAEVFMPLVGLARDDTTIALNAETPIEVLDERCFDWVSQRGDGRGVRGYSRSEWGVCMGIWNVREDHGWVRDGVSMEDVASVLDSKQVVCWSRKRQQVFLLQEDPAEVVLGELEFDVLTLVEMEDEIVCLGLIHKYNTLAAIQGRHGNKWQFKCLGEAVWIMKGHRSAVVEVEGEAISTLRYHMGDLTVVRASLTDFGDRIPSQEKFWTVEVVSG